jgi:hypothetical protein
MVRKDHLDLNNIVERYPKRPRRSGGVAGGIGDGTTPPFSNSNDIITPTDTNFNFNSLSANQVNGGEILSSSSVHHLNQYTATATTTDTQQQQQQGCRTARRWVKVLRQPQCMLNEPYFGNNTKANFHVYTWIPITQLTSDERIQYEEKESRIHHERMMWWNKNIISTPAAAVATTAKRRRSSSSGSGSSTMKEDENVDEENEKANDEEEDNEEKIASTGQPSSVTTADAVAAVENFEISTTTTSTPVQDTSAPASFTLS